jgi:hypothetical protein
MDNFNYIVGHKSIKAAIKSVGNATVKVQDQIHLTLCSAVNHAIQHGDTSLITSLFNVLPNSINKGKGVYLWVKKYTNLTYGKAKDGSMQFLTKAKTPLEFDLSGLSNPFWNMPEVMKANEPLDGVKAVYALMKRLENDESGNSMNAEVLKRLEATFADIPAPQKKAANKSAKPSVKTETDEVPFEDVSIQLVA